MKSINARPLRDRVIILPDEKETKTEGGIIIPDTAQERPRKGYVVASGPGLKDLPNDTKPGDRVYFGKFAGTEIVYADTEYLIMHESDILLIEPPTE